MNSSKVTITSKNQITLPANYVRQLNLKKSKTLLVEFNGNSIKLTPQVSVESSMSQYWGKHKASRPLTDDELKQAIRSGIGK